MCGSIAQLGEHLPYKQRVIGSSPIVPIYGLVVQLVRTLACHARGRGFESHPGRQTLFCSLRPEFASVAQLVEQRTENPRVVGSIPTGGTICGFSSFGRAPPCQGGGGGFEPRNPLQEKRPFRRSFFYPIRRIGMESHHRLSMESPQEYGINAFGLHFLRIDAIQVLCLDSMPQTSCELHARRWRDL